MSEDKIKHDSETLHSYVEKTFSKSLKVTNSVFRLEFG